MRWSCLDFGAVSCSNEFVAYERVGVCIARLTANLGRVSLMYSEDILKPIRQSQTKRTSQG